MTSRTTEIDVDMQSIIEVQMHAESDRMRGSEPCLRRTDALEVRT